MDKNTSPIVHMLPSLTDLAFLMPIVFLFTRMQGAKSMLGDGDTGWHIRTGQWILANGRVPTRTIFSYTKPDSPGMRGNGCGMRLRLAVSVRWSGDCGYDEHLAYLLTFALLFRLVRRHCENPFVAVAVTFLACSASSLHWLARPHLVTMLFTVILLFVLERDREAPTPMAVGAAVVFHPVDQPPRWIFGGADCARWIYCR